jgi:metacaspase-1
MKSPIKATILAVAIGWGACVSAAPRALLVGIGDYAMKDADLPGIDLDIQNMQQLASIMGFKPEEVRVLFNKDATMASFDRVAKTWLREGVTTNDPVLIYFSGHGTRIPDLDGDEPDAADEVLLLQDAAYVSAAGGKPATMTNVLVDDALARLLASIPSQKVLVLIDACNSGTATRNVSLANHSLGVQQGIRKFMPYPGMPAGNDGVLERRSVSTGSNYAAVSAAEDTQYAIATSQGGVFTLGVYDAVRSAASKGRQLSVAAMRDQVSNYIKAKLDPSKVHNPVTTGNADLIGGGLALTPAPVQNGEGPTWEALVALVKQGKPAKVTAGKPAYILGEEIKLEIESPVDGYLNLITVDASDQTTVLFPNRFQPNNQIKAGMLSIPRADMPFTLPAAEPLGPTLVVAFISTKPVDVLALGIEGRDASGKMQEVFTALSASATRAIAVAAREPDFLAGMTTINVSAAKP